MKTASPSFPLTESAFDSILHSELFRLSGAKSNQSPSMKEALQFIAITLFLAACAYVALFLAQAF